MVTDCRISAKLFLLKMLRRRCFSVKFCAMILLRQLCDAQTLKGLRKYRWETKRTFLFVQRTYMTGRVVFRYNAS